MTARPVRVLIVDDSALVRRVLADALRRYPDVAVVGMASDPYEARERIVECAPDVLTLDIEMPRMDGLTFLEKLMQARPIPVVIVSSVAQAGSANAIRALAMGAVEVVPKPGDSRSVPDVERRLVHAVRAAGRATVRRGAPQAAASAPVVRPAGGHAAGPCSHHIIAIGASTGGPAAIETVLSAFPADAPGTVIVQHMPPGFTRSFAERLDRRCAIRVREAVDGERVRDGEALLAPGGWHMQLRGHPGRFTVQLRQGPAVHHQRPAADVLFDSAASAAGARAVGVLLTGMGADGARGLLAMRQAGAWTIAQDEASSVVWGMPREAVQLGAACEVLPLDAIGSAAVHDAAPAPAPPIAALSGGHDD